MSGEDASVSYKGFCFTARQEACVLPPYPDGVRDDGSIKYSNGYGNSDPMLTATSPPTTPEAALIKFRENIRAREKDINRWLKVDVAQNEFDTLSDAYYQIGSKVRKVIDLINAGDKPEAMAVLSTFNKKRDPKTKKMVFSRGLHMRRTMEINLFLKADYADMVPDTFKPAMMKYWEGNPNTTPYQEVPFPPAF